METKEKNVSNEQALASTREEVPLEVLRPVGSVVQIVQAWKEYEALKRALLTENDWYAVSGNPPKLKRSGWQKLGAAFGLEDDVINEVNVQDPTNPLHWATKFTVRVRARNGRTAIGVGSCSTKEFSFRLGDDGRITYPEPSKKTGRYEILPLDHFVQTKAHTRAKCRAIADMLGGAEEIAEDFEEQEPAQASAARAAQSEGFKGAPQQKIDPSHQAIATNFLKNVLGEDLVQLIRLEEKDGEVLVILPAPMAEGNRTRFLKAMLTIGQGIHESAQGLVAHMKAPRG